MNQRFFKLVASLGLLAGAPCMAQEKAPDKAPEPTKAHEKAPEAAPAQTEDSSLPPASTTVKTEGVSMVELLRLDAARTLPTVKSHGAQHYLLNTNWAPVIEESREVFYNRATRDALTPTQFAALPKEGQAGYESVKLDEKFYYHTRYGSPHAYARPFDLLCQAAGEGNDFAAGKRLLDYGSGGLAHLRLLAVMGMHAVGVDVDSLLRAYFRNPEDTGRINGEPEGTVGTLQMEYGFWPVDEELKRAVGGNFDFIISKNTLKKGYIHPAKPVDERMLIKLGVTDEAFVGELFTALKPGGLMIIYNICPAQSEEKYIPWADGTNPFAKEVWEKAGFEVLNYDTEDQAGVKALATALGWDVGDSPMDIEKDLFAWYSIVRKPAAKADAKPDTKPDAKASVPPAVPSAPKK